MLRVVLHDLAVVPAVLAGAPAPVALSSAPEDALDRLADALSSDDGPTLVVRPSWSATAARQVATVRAALDRHDLLVVETDLSPGAASVLGTMASPVSRWVSEPGLLPLVLDRLGARFSAHGLLASVTGLERLQPSLTQHVASWAPNSRFLATVGADRGVQRIGRRTGLELPPLPEGHATIVFGDGDLRDELVEGAQQGRGGDQLPVNPPVPGMQEWWGTEDVAELVDHPSNVGQATVEVLTAAPPTADCAWCGRLVPGGPCPFCANQNGAAA